MKCRLLAAAIWSIGFLATFQNVRADESMIGSIPGWTFEAINVAVDALREINPTADLSRYKIEVSQHNKLYVVVSFVAPDHWDAERDVSELVAAYQVLVATADTRVIHFGPIE